MCSRISYKILISALNYNNDHCASVVQRISGRGGFHLSVINMNGTASLRSLCLRFLNTCIKNLQFV
jgi:hypothetical protein